MGRGNARGVWFSAALLWLTAGAQAAPPSASSPRRTSLQVYFDALRAQHLTPAPADDVDEIRRRVQRADELAADARYAQAAALLFEVVHSPVFADFADLEPFQAARYTLAGLLMKLGALRSAQATLDPILRAGPDDAYFAPAYRRSVSIALEHGALDQALDHLAQQVTGPLPAAAQQERAYLKGRAAFDRGAVAAARESLAAVERTSRFYANAQYLLGALDARERHYADAERRFCTIADTGRDNRFSFFVDERFFEVRDLAWLALGRVAHETRRADDAFYYYFQVPSDSPRLAEALFEAAYASYEGGDHDAAIDSLDQLEARFAHSPPAAEAAVLRGYVHLARCEFSDAERHLTAFQQRFSPVLRELDAALASHARRAQLYRDLVERRQSIEGQRARGEPIDPTPDSLLLSLISADPAFYRLHQMLRQLKAESVRAASLPRDFAALRGRLLKDAPRTAADPAATAAALDGLRARRDAARAAVAQMETQLARLRRAGAPQARLKPLREQVAALDARTEQLAARLRERLRAVAGSAGAASTSDALGELLAQDQRHVAGFALRAAHLTAQLERAAGEAGYAALTELRERLASALRRARIGRIDAVMGAKRQLELQVESLSAGRFPPELIDPLRVQGLLRDDEEYWPFEGEDWADEFTERYPDEGEAP